MLWIYCTAEESRVKAFPPRILDIVQAADLLDTLPPVVAPSPEWNAKASAQGGGHVVGMSGLDLLDESDPRRRQSGSSAAKL